MSIPTVCRGTGTTLFAEQETVEADGLVLFLYINFSVRQRDLRGYIAMMMDMPSLRALKGLLAEFIQQVVGDQEVA